MPVRKAERQEAAAGKQRADGGIGLKEVGIQITFPVDLFEARIILSVMADKKTILIAEDDPNVLCTTRMMLEKLGYDVLTAINGADALRVYQAHRGRVDLVLTDTRMPVMDGLNLYEALAQIDPAVKVLLMSAYNVQEWITDPRINKMQGIIQKPFSLDELIQAVQKALSERRDG